MTEELKQIGSNETQLAELTRLPLWKACVEGMIAEGIEYGKTYPAEYFEKVLKVARTEMQFGLAVSEIRRVLEAKGFYLSGRGLKGNSFIILAPSSNKDVMAAYSSSALDALKRGVILGTNTRLDTLTAEEKRKHISMLEKLATRLVLMRKSKTITNCLERKQIS